MALVGGGIFFGGCEYDLPIAVYIESDFTDDEVAHIIAAMDEWNETCGTLLESRGPIFVYYGRIVDSFEPNDLQDDKHVVYRISRVADMPMALRDDDFSGYATRGDVLLVIYALSHGQPPSYEYYLADMETIALHEFGHLMGLPHMNSRYAVMNEGHEPWHLTEADIDHFCTVYDCVNR